MKLHTAFVSSAMLSIRRIWSDRFLFLSTKVRVYQTLVLPISAYGCKTWTLLAADIKRLEAFHMECQRHPRRDVGRTTCKIAEVSSLTVLGSVLDPIVRRRSPLFGHVARLPEGSVHGLTNSAGTATHQSGDEPSHVDWTVGGDATILTDCAPTTTTTTKTFTDVKGCSERIFFLTN